MTASWRAGKRVRPPPPQPPYPPNTHNSFDHKLEGGKEGEAPPPPTPYPDWAARAPLAVISSPSVCVWGGESARHRGRGWDARQIFATNREGNAIMF